MVELAENPTLLAFFLPQFHPIPENDEWWGNGFTEWTNVTRSRPLFPRHYQPHLPADLGFYDLRTPETRASQASMARAFGVGGFCYYHYWFSGRRILEKPVDDLLASGQPDFPFLLCWANENWTRAWDGGDKEVLLEQIYSAEDDRRHMESLLPAFTDPRYLTVDGRPFFLVYHTARMPDALATARRWREVARAAGLPDLYLGRVDRFPGDVGTDPRSQGFDVAVEFQPDGSAFGQRVLSNRVLGLAHRVLRGHLLDNYHVFDYAEMASALPGTAPAWPRYPCVTPGWDNSARRSSGATVLHKSTPGVYEAWLRRAVDSASAGQQPPVVFVNAWNEWAEGAHLEPDQRWGRAYLEATKRVMQPHAR